jgi:hypothetical protein
VIAWCLSLHRSEALEWKSASGYRSVELTVPRNGKTGFTPLAPAQTGIHFTNVLSDDKAAENQIRLLGSGVALGDVDGDGWCDIYLCGLDGPNALFHNLSGWKFQDVTAQAGVACPDQYSTGAVLADVDGDADLDLLVNSLGGGTRLFFNDGKGHFTEATNSGLVRKFGSTSMALADVDGDGDLDLYVANYRTTTIRSTGLAVLNVNGKRVLRPEDRDQYEFTSQGLLLEHGEIDVLYLNDSKGRFSAVPWTRGNFLDEDSNPLTAGPKDWGLSVMFRDMNGDLAPDIYICNDFWSPDRVWINDGQGKFRAIPRLALRNSSTFSMGVDFADVNRDGYDDVLVLDMLSRDHSRRMRQRALTGQNFNQIEKIDDRPQVERNTLHLNRGDGTYAEVAQLSGVQGSEWSWGIAFVDVDLDGFEDLLVTNGHGFDTQDVDTEARIAALGPVPNSQLGRNLLLYPRLNVPKVAFRNRGDLTFEEVGTKWGFDAVGVSHGIALADLDNDGDLDVVVNNLNRAAGIYRNECIAPRVAVRLKGRSFNSHGIGAKIKFLGGPVAQSQEMICGGRYLSGDDPMRVFATGTATNGLSIEITWRSGRRTLLSDVKPNHLYEAEESNMPPAVQSPIVHRPCFEDVSSLLGHTHRDEPFDDFARQSLLSRRFSQLGPGVAWCDFDQDGREDLIIAAGRGHEPVVFRNRGEGAFEPWRPREPFGKAAEDQTSLLCWPSGERTTTLLIGQSNYEAPDPKRPSVRRYEISAGAFQAGESLPGDASSVGPLALADVDGDGDLDLFVGGRIIPGRYPEAAASRLYRNESGKFQLSVEWPGLGLVSGAVFSDLDADGFPELILACDWGPIRVFRNRAGRFIEATEELGLAKYRGWWNGVTTGDFDGDGRLDIVAANSGRNTPYQDFVRDEVRVFYGEMAGRGTVDTVEAYLDPKIQRIVPWLDLDRVAAAIPWVRERFATSRAYGEATLEEIFGEKLKASRELRINWLETTLFLNRTGRFEARPLPGEAQFAPAFGVCVGDFNGDGHEDVFLGQNFFAVDEQTSRYDAGRGLWLRGDGKGNLSAVSGQESGVQVYGEQRGAALCDYDADGRVDLVVCQNAAATKLYRNVGGKPGLRVRLKGPAGNPAGIGAVLWLSQGERPGAVREVHAGSGYWSQDSTVQVLGINEAKAKISVRWPGGKLISSEIPPGAEEIAIDIAGKVIATR